jgi:hypothetical protein
MINIETTERSVRELIENAEVNIVVHGCNCFHNLKSDVSQVLKELTNDDIAAIDRDFSEYGDINKLGTWTSNSYVINNAVVEIYNLYSRYTSATDGNDPIHWKSVFEGLFEILNDECESGQVLAVEALGSDERDQTEFKIMLDTILSGERDLPDVDIILITK